MGPEVFEGFSGGYSCQTRCRLILDPDDRSGSRRVHDEQSPSSERLGRGLPSAHSECKCILQELGRFGN